MIEADGAAQYHVLRHAAERDSDIDSLSSADSSESDDQASDVEGADSDEVIVFAFGLFASLKFVGRLFPMRLKLRGKKLTHRTKPKTVRRC